MPLGVISVLEFYWRCVKWAARGTMEMANAWFWPVGVPIVALVGWYLGVGTLTIPDNLQNFVVFMVLTVAVSWGIFFVIRLFGAPHHLVSLVARQRDDLIGKIEAIGEERPLAYDHVEFKTFLEKRKNKIHFTAVVYFTNHGERMLKWRLLSFSIEANGKKLVSPTATIDYFVNRGQRCWFNYPTLETSFTDWPVAVDVSFDCEYDNVPPIRIRYQTYKSLCDSRSYGN